MKEMFQNFLFSSQQPVVGRRLENLFTDDSHIYSNVGSPTKNGVSNGTTVSSPGPICKYIIYVQQCRLSYQKRSGQWYHSILTGTYL